MRSIPEALAVVLVGWLGAAVGAQDAREVVERGMKARCEKVELLDKQRCEIITAHGKMLWTDQKDKDATTEIQIEWPTTFRWDWVIAVGELKQKVTLSMRGDKGWRQFPPAPAVDMDVIEMDGHKMEMHGRWLATLYPLKDKAFALTLLKDNRVGDEDVTVVKAALRFRPDVYLSFSKKSGHLLKVAYKGREGGVDVRKEHLLSDYKEFEGIKLPTKLVDMQQSGAQTMEKKGEWTVSSYKFPDKLDASVFDKPAEKK
jgi:hypothetical protein